MSSNRLFTTGMSFQRNEKGAWQLSRMATNHGVFGMGKEENDTLDKETVDRFCSYVNSEIRPLLQEFINEEELSEIDLESEDKQENGQTDSGDST